MAEPIDPLQRAVEASESVAVLTVTLFRDGHITVNGPLPNEDLCLRMLADALAAVRQFKRHPQAVTVPRLIVPTDLGGNGKG